MLSPRLFSLLFAGLVSSTSLLAAGKCERLVATGNPEYPPYLWQDPQNPEKLIGANADLLAAIGEAIGVKIDVLYSGPWSQAQDEVRSGRVDLLAGAFITLERLELMDYIHPAFYETQSLVWVHKGREFPFAHWDDLKGKAGGKLVDNSSGQAFDTFAKANLTLESVPSLAQAFQQLLLDRTDYVVYERYPGVAVAETLGLLGDLQALDVPVSSEGLFLGLSHDSACNDPWLRGQLAKKMTELAASGLPETLLQRNLALWRDLQSQPVNTSPNK
ncbi:substrate-binding periplasmic protein [Pseudomonas sp. LRF_L74]|uniref:substrate-binding periplasmic protein n=1 Tax=Pseudomonas sp. LRF_L74 TaxID=3369422 RepID=UPI003F644C03